MKSVSEVKLLKLDLLGCTRLIRPSTVIGLQDKSKVRRVASLVFAESTKHSDAVKNVEFSRNSKILNGQHDNT